MALTAALGALWLVRHARPLVAAGVCYGRLDLPADAQANAEAARALAAQLPPAARLFASPLQRCEQLAQAVCGLRPDLTVKTEPALQEFDFGTWEGQRWDAIGAAALQAWSDDFASYRCGGAESVQMLMQRVAAALAAAEALRQSGPDVVWLTHAGVARAVLLLRQGLHCPQRADQWPSAAPAFGQGWRLP